MVDAGAYHGEWTAFYRTAFPDAEVHAFEPFPDSAAVFRDHHKTDPHVHLVSAALGDAAGTAFLRVNQLPATNSLLATSSGAALDDPSMVKTVGEIEVPVVTLDEYASEQGINRINVLKMDVQGSEPAVLAGADGLLRAEAIDAIYTEVIFQPVYHDQGDPFQVCNMLHAHRYTLFGIYNLAPTRSGRMLQADILFISPVLTRRLES